MRLTCTACGTDHDPSTAQTVCTACGQPLLVEYGFVPGQLDAATDLEDIDSLWRYQRLLPPTADSSRVTLGEGRTPLVAIPGEGRTVFLKDETGNPTGSFKDRGMALAFTMAKHYGIERVALPSAGNAGVAAAAYAEAAGLACRVFMPRSIPAAFIEAAAGYGAEIVLAGNTIAEAGTAMAADLEDGCFNFSTLKEPYRVEGKKTMGLEIAEQLGWSAPDVVVYPAGGGTGLVGIWKALIELKQLGWIDGPLPRMVAVQMAGCAPVVQAFTEDRPTTEPWPAPETSALGLNVPAPLGGAWMLRVLRESGGAALSIEEADLPEAGARLREISGLPAGPEAAAAWRGYEQLAADNWIRPGETAVVVVTGDDRRYS